MMHSRFMHVLMLVSWAVTALAAIHLGVLPFGYNIFSTQIFMNNMVLADAIHYFVGICGIYSLVLMVMMITCKCGTCEYCKGK